MDAAVQEAIEATAWHVIEQSPSDLELSGSSPTADTSCTVTNYIAR